MIRADLARQQPGDDTLAVSDAQLAQWFTARGINATFHHDGRGFSAPGRWRTHQPAEGSWLFLDGGELDLGIVRDSTLKRANDAQVFAETFEAAAFIGDAGSFRDHEVACAVGETAGSVVVDCAVGS